MASLSHSNAADEYQAGMLGMLATMDAIHTFIHPVVDRIDYGVYLLWVHRSRQMADALATNVTGDEHDFGLEMSIAEAALKERAKEVVLLGARAGTFI